MLLDHGGVFNDHGTGTWLSKYPLTLMWLVAELCVIEGKLKFWQNFILRQSNYRAPTLGVKTSSFKR